MQVDRAAEIIFVDGKPQESLLDSIDIYLESEDISQLYHHQRLTNRFMECALNGFGIPGWAPEDKIHITLEERTGREYEERYVDLHLDGGGDMYFTIWNRTALFRATNHEEFIIGEGFMPDDPTNKLGEVGIKAVRMHNLRHLANRLAGMRTL